MSETSLIEIAVTQAVQLSQNIAVISLIVFIICLVLFFKFKQKTHKFIAVISMIVSLIGLSCGIPVLFLIGINPFNSDDKAAVTAYQNALNTSILPDMKMAMSISLSMSEPSISKADKLTKAALKLAKSPKLKSEICREFGIRVANMHYTSLAFKYFEQAYKYEKPSSNDWTAVGLIYMQAGKYDEAIKIYSDIGNNALVAQGYIMKKDYDNALMYINKAIEKSANPDTYATRANIYLNMGNISAANSDCRIAISSASQQRVEGIYNKCSNPEYFRTVYSKK